MSIKLYDLTRVSMAVQSILSDCIQEGGPAAPKKLHFVKWLINKYPDTSVKIDIDGEYDKYEAWYYEVTQIEQEQP